MRTGLRALLKIWTYRDLRTAGVNRREIAARLESGTLRRCAPGWYAEAGAPADVTSALRRGNRLTCVPALKHYGVWVVHSSGLHEIGRRSTSAPLVPASDDSPVHTHGRLEAWPDDEPIMPLLVALEHASACVPVEDLAIMLDSVANRGLAHPDDLEGLLLRLPQKVHRAIGRIEKRAESGTETRVRRHLQKLRVKLGVQVRIAGVGRVDLLVGEKLIIECDSRQFHTGDDTYHEDRRRDREAVLRGYVVVRLTWRDVMLDWESTSTYLTELVRHEIHRAPRMRRTGQVESRPRLRTQPSLRTRVDIPRRVLGTSAATAPGRAGRDRSA